MEGKVGLRIAYSNQKPRATNKLSIPLNMSKTNTGIILKSLVTKLTV